MTTDVLKYLGMALLLLFIQVLVLNNIRLYGYATPLMLVYIILLAPANAPRWALLVGGFAVGLVSDIFANTPGVCAASLTLIGFVQPLYLNLFLSRESDDDLVPSIESLGLMKFFSYSFALTLLFLITFYTIAEFSFFHWQQWLYLIGGSTLLTYLLIFVIEIVRSK